MCLCVCVHACVRACAVRSLTRQNTGAVTNCDTDVVDRERERRLEEMRAIKSEYKEGVWNANCVLMGGLGKDPSIQG